MRDPPGVDHPRADDRALSHRFGAFDRLTVRQRRRTWEVILSFEFRNAYEVFDEHGQAVLRAQEVGAGAGEFLSRMFLGTLRPLHVQIQDLSTGAVLLELRRPFRLLFQEMTVKDGQGQVLGHIQQHWSWFQRIYSIRAQTGETLDVVGPFFRPWTFELRSGGTVVGAIKKRWSGLGTEIFTDADNFGVELDQVESPSMKALAFAATVLIDVVHFEKSK